MNANMASRTVSTLAFLVASAFLVSSASAAAVSNVGLGAADAFAVLAGSGITNTGTTTIKGNVGSHPTPAQTGFGPGADSVTLTGANHHDDAVTQGAKSALVTAYNDAAGRPGATPIAGGDLGGRTLTAGVYADDNAPDSLAITGTLTLDGANDPSSVFIFQSGSTLVTASASNVVLTRGAQACHVFWQVTSSATLGSGSHLVGSVLALTSITLGTGASVDGRVLARNGAVTMHGNTIQVVPCAAAAGGTTSASSSSTTTSASSTTSHAAASSSSAPANATAAVPFFPTVAAFAIGGVGAVGGAYLILRKRR